MKLELNVKRFNNEDVIATSGICEHASNFHYYVEVCNRQSDNMEEYYIYMFNPVTEEFEHWNYNPGKNYYNLNGVNSTGWYYSSDGGISFTKCDENCEHPIQPN